MFLVRSLLILLLLLPLSACVDTRKAASSAEIAAAAYTDTESPASITLMTMISNRSGRGGHTALLINGSQRVIWDPAGTWWNSAVPEAGDMLFGITPVMLDYYLDYHARPEYRVVLQTVEVPRELADEAIRRFRARGPAAKATCANTTSAVLRTLPGFESLPHTWYPEKLMEAFARLPGVRTTIVRDDTVDPGGYAPGDYVIIHPDGTREARAPHVPPRGAQQSS